MIDSSGRRALRANGTVLDLLPVGHVIATAGLLLVLLFTWVRPEASNGLGVAGRLGFWMLHVGLGLLALWVATQWLASGARLPGNVLAAVLLSGCAGVVIAAPGYLALDALYAPYIVDVDSDPPPPAFPVAMMLEIVELAPWFLTSWLLINLPVLMPKPQPALLLDDEVEHQPEELDTTPQIDSRGHRFLDSLPGVVGTDVIAVSSDLHYLNVWTVAGRTTVLGKLRDVVDELEDQGMQIHRSHWVAHAHVRRITGSATNAACLLSNQLRVPVSRRRWAAVREQYGRGVVHSQLS